MSERSKKLLDDMQKKRGYIYPPYKLLALEDPDFLEAYDKLYELVMPRKRIFPEKTKELFYIVAIASRNPSDNEALKNHIRRALDKGAKKGEIVEALQCAFFPGGALSLLYGLRVLMEVLEEKR
jgi:alkylhydroperoxidase/carboxymuconolactone decarboxylase family protein YurZ